MKIYSKLIPNASLEQVVNRVENHLEREYQLNTLDDLNNYSINLRVRYKGVKGSRYFVEIPTKISIRQSKAAVLISYNASLLKVYEYSFFVAIILPAILCFTKTYLIAVILFCVIFQIYTMVQINWIRKRIQQLSKELLRR